MTTATHDAPIQTRRLPRTVEVARINSVAWPLAIVAPAGVLLIAFAINIGIFALIPNPESKTMSTGGMIPIFFFGLGFYIQAITQTLPFAVGLSVSRREYYRATVATAVVQSAAFGAILYALSLVESATNGWGMYMRFFGIAKYATDNPIIQLLTLVAALLLAYSVGLLIGAVYLRWKLLGFFGFVASALVLLGGASIVITWQTWWPNIGDALIGAPRIVVLVIVPGAVSVLFIVAGWLSLRRAAV